jgi:hypothetical protein
MIGMLNICESHKFVKYMGTVKCADMNRDTPGQCRHPMIGNQQRNQHGNHSSWPSSPKWAVPFPMHVAVLLGDYCDDAICE